jgi:hypothetical protein
MYLPVRDVLCRQGLIAARLRPSLDDLSQPLPILKPALLAGVNQLDYGFGAVGALPSTPSPPCRPHRLRWVVVS